MDVRVWPVHYDDDENAHAIKSRNSRESVDAWGVYTSGGDGMEMWEADFTTKEEADDFAADLRGGNEQEG